MSMLDKPLESTQAYVSFMARQDIPVLRQTLRELHLLENAQESINGKRIAAVVLGDPLLTMKLLAWLQAHRHESQNHDITTIDRAIMMIGIQPFFRAFAGSPTLEEQLSAHPQALLGALNVIRWTRKAAHLARDWALLRHDLEVDEITVAALLRQATDIMFWIFASPLAERVHEMQQQDASLRSAAAQRQVLGTSEREIQRGLVRIWKLPELLITLMDEADAANPRVRNVRLAIDFARHLSQGGWDNPALPDDLREIERLLRMTRAQVLQRLGAPASAQELLLG